jgi:hypothetical protein
VEVGYYDPAGKCRGVHISGNYAYMANDEWGLSVVDVSNPANPFLTGYCNTGGYSYAVDVSGDYAYMANYFYFEVFDCADALAVEDNTFSISPLAFSLDCSPNPFNYSLDISFELRDASPVELRIFDTQGRKVWSMVNGQWSTGKHKVVWNAEGVPSGIYFIQLSAISCQLSASGCQSMVQKAVLIK